MKKFIFAGITAVVISCAMGFASANAEGVTAKTENCACKKCACDDCKCNNCNEQTCNKGCDQDGQCSHKAGKSCCSK
ncbi:MAG: hypothetical protein P4L41_18770 [Flavipsychrobacter sp.]|nr:hypothetical protein [Flavipsychrobacter sp.]